MQIHALFFDKVLQDIIFADLERDIETFKDASPGLMGLHFKESPPGPPATSINGFFPGSEPSANNAARKLCDSCNLDGVKDGPQWARIWLMLILVLVSPRLTQSVLSEPGPLGVSQRAYINGKTTGFRLPPFHERMHTMMCGDMEEANAMTPFEIVVRELYQLRHVMRAGACPRP